MVSVRPTQALLAKRMQPGGLLANGSPPPTPRHAGPCRRDARPGPRGRSRPGHGEGQREG